MNDLIKIEKTQINGAEINSVNARDLYSKLGLSKGQYSRWIQTNLIDQFLYNDDYIGVRQYVEGNEVVSHIVTIDTAKHLCMMAKTENAMKFRKYFIEIEKRYINTPTLPQNYIEALEALTKSEKEKLQLQNNIQEKDKVILAVADLNIKSGEVNIGDFSKNIAIPNLGQNNMYKWLKGRGFLTMDRKPYQPYVERGYFVRRPSKEKINGEYRYTTYLTAKGTVWLAKILRAEFELDEVQNG